MELQSPQSIEDLETAIPQITEQVPYLKLLVLFGSRARGDNHAESDWDFAAIYDEELRKQHETGGWDWFTLWVVIEKVLKLPDDKVDVVDLGKCSNILAHSIARDGKLLYQKESGEFEQFKQRALMSKAELKAFREEQKEKIKAGLERLKK